MRKKFAPKNYSRERNLDPRSTHEKKNWARKIPTRITFESTKYPREIILDPRNTHEKNFGSTIYPRENSSDPRKIHKGPLGYLGMPGHKHLK